MNKNFISEEDNFNGEDINFSFLLNSFRRNKKLITKFLVVFIIFSSLFTFFVRKKIWEGKFEIVIGSGSDITKQKSSNIQLLALAGLNNQSTLQTEVGILKSPSVLLPVFNFVKKEYKLKYPNANELIFSDWKKKKLAIDLQKNTSILSITYSDKNKELVIPVLERISKEYKAYSGKNKRKNLELAKIYLEKQIQIYKLKSADSLKKAQEYAIDQDLTTLNLNLNTFNQNLENSSKDSKNDEDSYDNFKDFAPSFLATNTGIEGVRVTAANRIRNIDQQIDKIQSLENDVKQLQYVGSTIPGLRATGLPQKLENIEAALVDLRSKYTDADPQILRLNEKRKIMVSVLRDRAIGYLKASRIQQEALMESATRPKGVILKYKEYMREAGRDEITLVNLENKLREISLEEARLENPWELINIPTLQKDPVSLSDIKFVFISSLLGVLLGAISGIIKEKKSGIIYEDKLISKSFESKILAKINLSSGIFEYTTKDIFFNEIIKVNEKNKFSFFLPVKHDSILINKLQGIFKELRNFKIENNFSEINDNSKIIIFVSIGKITKKEIDEVSNRLNIQGKKIFGLVIVES